MNKLRLKFYIHMVKVRVNQFLILNHMRVKLLLLKLKLKLFTFAGAIFVKQ